MTNNSSSKLTGILLTIGAVLVVAGIGAFLAMRPEPPASDMEKMTGNISEMLDEMMEGVESADFEEGKPFIDKTFSTESDIDGPMGEVQSFVAESMNEQVEITNRYAAELEAIGYLNLLNPDRMSADAEFADSYRILSEVDVIVAKYRGLQEEQLDGLLEKVDRIDASESFKTGMKAGLAMEIGQSKPVRDQIWNLEQKTVDEVRLLVGFLEQSTWASQGGQFVFETEDALAVFNGHLSNINTLTEEQMGLRRDMVQKNQDRMKGMFD